MRPFLSNRFQMLRSGIPGTFGRAILLSLSIRWNMRIINKNGFLFLAQALNNMGDP